MKFLDYVAINPKVSLEKGKIYPFVEMCNVSSCSRNPNTIEYKCFNSGVKFEKGDTVIARITPCLQNGKRFYCKDIVKGFGSTEYLVFRPKDSKIDSLFLYYFMNLDFIKESMIKSMTGATGRQRVNNDVFSKLEVQFPDITVQRRIASILSAYDDLIENNQRQIKLLEEAAQRLYKEWFIDLRFPGWKNTPIVDGVPEGWEVRKVSEFGKIITGKTPSTEKKQYYGGSIPFVKIPDMHNCVYPNTTEITLTTEGANSQRNKFIPQNAIMVSCIATVGLVNIAIKPCQTNQQINSIILNNEQDLYYVYSTMKRLKALLEGIGSNGATMTNVNKKKFGNLEFLYPGKELNKKYFDYCKPLFEKILTLSESIKRASQARDRLLPKLMSGELEVK